MGCEAERCNTMVLCPLRLSLIVCIIWFLTVLANCGGHLVWPSSLWGPVDHWAKNNKPPLNKEVVTFCVLNAQVLSKRTDDGDLCLCMGRWRKLVIIYYGGLVWPDGGRLGSLADGPEFMSLPWLGRLLWSVEEVPRVMAGGLGGGGVTDDNDGHKNATMR